MLIPIEKIKVDRERYRGAAGDMEGLAQSIASFGQLQPIVVDQDFGLIAGFRRYTACLMNGQRDILAVQFDDIDELLAKEMELEENIQRLDMTWQEKAKALAQLDALKRSRDPNWGQTQTAALAGTGQNRVAEAVQLANAMEIFPELAEAKSANQARSWLKQKASNIVRVHAVKNNKLDYGDIEAKIHLGDSVEVIKMIPDELITAHITDPPFGLDMQDRKAGTEGTMTSYQDDEVAYRRLLSMAPDLYRTLKPNGWLVWFFGISWYEECKLAFREAGFTVDEIPIIWNRSDGRVHTNRPDHYFGRGYDVALHCFKGDPQIIKRNLSNVLTIPPVEQAERVTLFERPIALYQELITRLTVPGELVADWFVGGGGCPAACAATGRDFIGCEQDAERRAWAIQKVKANTPS